MQKQDLNLSARGGSDSLDASVRSDAKLFGSEMKGNNERFNKASRGKITEVDENDLELEGGANDIP
jgi:hypothetical protein